MHSLSELLDAVICSYTAGGGKHNVMQNWFLGSLMISGGPDAKKGSGKIRKRGEEGHFSPQQSGLPDAGIKLDKGVKAKISSFCSIS